MNILRSKYIIWGIVILLGYTIWESTRLVLGFQHNNTQNNTPTAKTLKLTQSDISGARNWTIMAKESESSTDMSSVTAGGVTIDTFGAGGQPVLHVLGDTVTYDQRTGRAHLVGHVNISFLQSNIRMTASELTLVQDQPINILGGVHFERLDDATKYINAARASLSADNRYLTLYQISKSHLGNGTYVSGGMSRLDLEQSQPPTIVISGGARVDTADMSCASQTLTTYMSAGRPVRAVFTGSPIATQNGKRLKATVIEYDFPTKKISAKGNISSF